MRLRTFTASDMPSAMKMVRDTLGDGAIILSSEQLAGKKAIKVTAAADTKDDVISSKSSAPREPELCDHIRFEVKNILHFHNIPELFIAKIMQKATDSELESFIVRQSDRDVAHLSKLALEKALSSYFRFDPLTLTSADTRIMLVGPPGIGKTLTIAKLAARLTMEKRSLAVITTDNKRAGGVEQLQAFTNILGIDLDIATDRDELMQLIKEHGRVPLLIDTAGCNPFDEAELRELQAYAGLKNIEPVLVLPAGGDSLEAIDIVEAFAVLPIGRLLVTRTDTARRFGGVLAAAAASELTFCNISSSSSIVDPIRPIDGALLAQLLLQYKES